MANPVSTRCFHLARRTQGQVADMVLDFYNVDGVLGNMAEEHLETLYALEDDPHTHFDFSHHVCHSLGEGCQCLICRPRPPVPRPVVVDSACPLCTSKLPSIEEAQRGMCNDCHRKMNNTNYNVCAACGSWAFLVLCPSPGGDHFACQGRRDLQ